ncbi:class II histocompatibility antigen, B-L beta chain-like, partial [Pipra filicauda]|uniref:Class II histocompatibility antigen, B-L beta chain-like n=1 Tax=Pipra filicauda TaxID=649802 RepID=A0A7R5KXP4_9PASS
MVLETGNGDWTYQVLGMLEIPPRCRVEHVSLEHPLSQDWGVFQRMFKAECHFINGTERVRYMERHIYNREQQLQFDSDLGVYVGDTPFGEIQTRYLNSLPGSLEYARSAVDTYCRPYYELDTPFSME